MEDDAPTDIPMSNGEEFQSLPTNRESASENQNWPINIPMQQFENE